MAARVSFLTPQEDFAAARTGFVAMEARGDGKDGREKGKGGRAAVEDGGGMDQVRRGVAKDHSVMNEVIEGGDKVDWGVDEVPRGDCEILMSSGLVVTAS